MEGAGAGSSGMGRALASLKRRPVASRGAASDATAPGRGARVGGADVGECARAYVGRKGPPHARTGGSSPTIRPRCRTRPRVRQRTARKRHVWPAALGTRSTFRLTGASCIASSGSLHSSVRREARSASSGMCGGLAPDIGASTFAHSESADSRPAARRRCIVCRSHARDGTPLRGSKAPTHPRTDNPPPTATHEG